MAVEYLLPCQCGRTTPVEMRQAGQTVQCECGTPLVVPTMRDLARLEQRQGASPAATRAWSTRSALVSLGLLVTLLGVSLTAYVYWKMPRIDPVAKGREVESMSPFDVWQWWRYYESGIPRYPSDEQMAVRGQELYYRRWSYFTIGIVLLGLLIVLAGLVVPALSPRRTRQ